MKVAEKKKTDSIIFLEVEANGDEVTKAFDVAQAALEQTLGIQSKNLTDAQDAIREKTGFEDIDSFLEPQVAEYLIPYAIDQSGIMPDFTPKVTRDSAAKRGSTYSFTLEVTPKPQFELSSYDPVTIRVPAFEINEAEVEKQIADMARSYGEYEQIEPRPAQLGDSCLITINSSRGGSAVPEITMENAIYDIGSHLVSDEFDTMIVGMSAGETKSFMIEYLPQAHSSFEEESKVECIVTLTEVRKRSIPTINDEWIKANIPTAQNLETFKQLIREEFKQSYSLEFEDAKRREASAELATRFKGDIQDEAFASMRTTLVNNLRIKLQKEGSTLDEYIEKSGGQKQFDLSMMMQAKDTLAQGYALDALFRHENMVLTEKDILDACMTMDPEQPELVKKQMEYAGCGFALRETAERLKASKWLLDCSEVIAEVVGEDA